MTADLKSWEVAYRADPDRIRFRWVKGHSEDPYNDLVDRLAVEAAIASVAQLGADPYQRVVLHRAEHRCVVLPVPGHRRR